MLETVLEFQLRMRGETVGSGDIDSAEIWSPDLGRIDVAATYRLTTHAQLKFQYSFQHETTAPGEDNHLLATQFTVRF